ncbi:hypothetical protein HMPREF0183_0725 [Brevibacterium mcbrellneri ATCC 49030]|uniref:AB hydrolase-1 domain-containing protein n=1 Tax=Brevibacterium mcbrellneri ATCC 49030 TaxID=585530 RepID=D4YLB5_9MICO|nr:alpha/beta hydrolase [Brevibacterium mcbrellneri]EFG47949.1 hypothetical protein HMPREF0183_0725 [Brevibacterium mcbrellneri ATCC 49030]
MKWVIVPGLSLLPEDYSGLSELLPGPVEVIDAWEHDPTGDIEDLRKAVDISEPFALIGHSVGGVTALEWALKYPKDIIRLVLLDPSAPLTFVGGWLTRGTVFERFSAPVVDKVARALTPWGAQIRKHLFTRASGLADHLPRTHATHRFVSRPGLQTVVDQWFSSWEQEYRLSSLLMSNHVLDRRLHPTIVCSSGSARAVSVAKQRRLARLIGAELHIAEGADHMFPVTEPQRVIAAL